jgi:NitT/TauT family transport system ATP-binding protein
MRFPGTGGRPAQTLMASERGVPHTRVGSGDPPGRGAPDPQSGSITVEGLSKTYNTRGGDVIALRDVSFTVPKGEFVSLVGPSGCGKSTVLKIVAGLIPFNTGLVDVAGSPARAGREDCAIMLQSAVMLPWRTVRDNVFLPIEILGLDRERGRRLADQWLDTVGLSNFKDKYPWELSGGMQQRVSLARLLVLEPDIMLMDEPFAALDEFNRERLNFEVIALHEQLHRSMVYVTHNITEAVLVSDQVVVMKPHPGEVVDIVKIDLPRPRTREVLDDPRTTELVSHIRHSLEPHSQPT